MNALKTVFFLALVPGLVIAYVPFQIGMKSASLLNPGLIRFLAIPLWLIALYILVWCARDFVTRGRGTPLPADPPKELVIVGPYRFTRNPMYLAAILALIAHIVWAPALWVMVYAACVTLAFHLFVTRYEEPTLRRKFGAAYEEYCRAVPRWLPRLFSSSSTAGEQENRKRGRG